MSVTESSAGRVLHQFLIHADVGSLPGDDLQVRYSYPFPRHPIPETLVTVPGNSLPGEVRAGIDAIRDRLVAEKVRVEPVRFPHTVEIHPTVKPGGLTILVQDQRRKASLPIVRLYVYEEVPELPGSKREIEARFDGVEFPEDLKPQLRRVQEFSRRVAWEDHQAKFGHLFRKP